MNLDYPTVTLQIRLDNSSYKSSPNPSSSLNPISVSSSFSISSSEYYFQQSYFLLSDILIGTILIGSLFIISLILILVIITLLIIHKSKSRNLKLLSSSINFDKNISSTFINPYDNIHSATNSDSTSNSELNTLNLTQNINNINNESFIINNEPINSKIYYSTSLIIPFSELQPIKRLGEGNFYIIQIYFII